jgi:hypothetical protein
VRRALRCAVNPACSPQRAPHNPPPPPPHLPVQVSAAVDAISTGASVVPYWPHALQDWLLQSLPDWALHAYLVPLHKGLRARYQRKLKDEEAQRSAAAASAPAPASRK